MSERRAVIHGMAEQLWWAAYEGGRKKAGRNVPPAARKAAEDLARLYEQGSGQTVQEIYQRVTDALHEAWKEERAAHPMSGAPYENYSPVELGHLLARAALHMSRLSPLEQIAKVPTFTIEIKNGELVWSGEVGDNPTVNPSDLDRDDAIAFGRSAYIMGMTASQAMSAARKQGMPEHLIPVVAEYWAKERSDTIHGGFRSNAKPKDYTMREASEFEGKESHTFEEVPHTKSLAEVRQLLARRTKRCSRSCPGWDVFETSRGFEIQVCDECNSLQPASLQLSDADVEQLPEAQKKLREVVAENMEQNPPAMSYANWCTALSKEAAKTGTRIEFGGETHDAWKRGLSPDMYIRELGGWGPRHWKAPSGRPPGVPNGRRR
jgi:hypothetical protein